MLDLVEWIRYHILEVSSNEVKYSIIFTHVCISIIHQICFLSIIIKASSYYLIVLSQGYKTIWKNLRPIWRHESIHIVQLSFCARRLCITPIQSYRLPSQFL